MVKSLVAIICLFLLVGCDREGQKKQVDAGQNFYLNKPSVFVGYGRDFAMYQHLSKVWQVSQINHIPLDNKVLIDFNDIAEGRGALYIKEDCSPITVNFSTDKSFLFVEVLEVERGEEICHYDNNEQALLENRLMGILSDLKRFEKKSNEELLLISYQDVLSLVSSTNDQLGS